MRAIFFAMLCVFSIMDASAGALNPGTEKVDSGNPGRRFYLDEKKLQKTVASAKSGNLSAISKLANHYQWAVSDQVQAIYWLRKGRN
ncbi:hypothetical protein [Lysobacter firmicutimachus]|uniref:Uncharacterized protein n=1 Tax=Lysobacter firmicutimachus TaxID=1792846 RepID=A0ABU8D146_9GAMM